MNAKQWYQREYMGTHTQFQNQKRSEAMANTLLMRPCVLCAASSSSSSSSRARLLRQALPFLLQSKKSSVSSPSSSAEETRSKLLGHSNGASGMFTGFGKSKLEVGFLVRRFSTRAANVNDAGSVESPLTLSMEKKIKEQLNAESVSVKDASGDGRHVCIDVISSNFEGQSAVNRQRMVYKAIWEELQSTVHAVDQMTTKTPAEATGNK